MRRSEAIARMAPAPAQIPSTAATIGCGQARIAFTRLPVMRVKASNFSCCSSSFIPTSGPMISCTSPPDEKFSPAPVITTTLTSGMRARRRKVSTSSPYEPKVRGFFFSGRLRVMVATFPSTFHPKCCGRNGSVFIPPAPPSRLLANAAPSLSDRPAGHRVAPRHHWAGHRRWILSKRDAAPPWHRRRACLPR